MPRRPRPDARRPPQRAAAAAIKFKPAAAAAPAKVSRMQFEEDVSEEEASGSGSPSDDSHEETDTSSGSDSGAEDFDEADAEPDAPRVAQWVDEEELDELSVEDSESDGSDEEGALNHEQLEADLKALPFGALRKAHKALSKVQVEESSEEETDYESESDDESAHSGPSRLEKGKEREEPREKKEVPKRKNKHAPMEMSSKRPVPRMKLVTEQKVVPRDPRFLPITGEFDKKRFHTQYGFLADMHEEEMKTLKENLKRARKLLANSPRDLREEREAEVQRLERAVKRAESAVNKDRQEKVQLEALSKVAKEERDKRKEGKKAWYMKNADKKALLLRAKYDALAASGGRGAVRKAIEKKQKKVSQKEKKKKPRGLDAGDDSAQ
ncbi:hypothetical protein ONZ51_g1614 [Trametes cubensis]|uniref:rRNA biogenesis protein RRP36 n=1 Tax=Trametes cubensis TaxID=1111947 RepID=A0AAD7U1R8_9APHY|nr:hypothetical protein ONZ51_g1614 [Trametes cubensis]